MWIETTIEGDEGRVLINIDHFAVKAAASPMQARLIFYNDKRKIITINTPYQFLRELIQPSSPTAGA